MLRLRTTTALSALGLLIGVAGTGWLSTFTAGWHGSPQHDVARRMAAPVHRAVLARSSRWHGPVTVVTGPHRSRAVAAGNSGVEVPATLVPLSMPPDTSIPWDALRGHLDGRVLVHLALAGDGRVLAASLAASSGDAVLDGHALRSVRGWRFVVPPGHRDGVSGELPMVFASRGASIARVP
jgi:protein TonB